MVAEICTIYQNDKRDRLVNRDKLERSTATIPRTTGTRDEGYDLKGDQTSALTEMTKTVSEREPSALPLYKLYTSGSNYDKKNPDHLQNRHSTPRWKEAKVVQRGTKTRQS